MKKLGVLILLMLAAGPVAAQNEAAPTPDAGGFGTADEAAPAPADATADAPADAATEAPAATADAAEAATDTATDATADTASDTAIDAPADAATEPAAEGTAEASAPADAAADAAVVDDSVAVESSETAEAEAAPSSSGGDSEPWELYVGTDYVWTQAKFSSDALKAEFGGEEFDSSMVRGRVGVRLFDKIGFEVHLGAGTGDTSDLDADEYSTQEFYGAYFVPTGVLFDLIEVGAAIGYAHTKLETAQAEETLGGVSFGVNLEVPVYTSDAVELRLGGGATMFRAQNSAQISGYFAGMRVDFKI